MRKFETRIFLIIRWVALLFLAACAQAQSSEKQADELARQYLEESNLSGFAISVSIGGELIWSQGFGYADLEQQVPISPAKTRFRVGSVAKPMTAMALGHLYESGQIDLDAPIQRYLPDYPEYDGVITARLLAGHLAGIRHYDSDNEVLNAMPYATVPDGLSIFRDDPLVATPGTKYHYSSYGFNLLSAVIESAAGEDFLSYMAENVFRRVGMDQTIADTVFPIISNRSRYYEVRDGELFNTPWVDNSYKWASGGFLSTSEDLVRFGNAHLSNDFLQAQTIEMLWTRQSTSAGEETNYGIGWQIGTRNDGTREVFHTGGSVGGTTVLLLYPDDGLVIAVISNTWRAGLRPLVDSLVDLYLDD
jgi:serine beta-lactamase-like protein LACTB